MITGCSTEGCQQQAEKTAQQPQNHRERKPLNHHPLLAWGGLLHIQTSVVASPLQQTDKKKAATAAEGPWQA